MRAGRAALLGAGLGLVALAALIDCRDPTELVVDVRTDDCAVRDTGISVGATLSSLRTAPAAAFNGHDGCERGTTDRIGTLTIYPSGGKSATVAFKVVTGVTRSAGECFASGDQGCIVATRKLRFAPGTSQTVVVKMSRKCLDAVCPEDQTCNEGVCVGADQIDPGGGLSDDASVSDATFVDAPSASDAAPEAAVDAGVDACAGCKGACDGGSCTVACGSGGSACTGEVCSPTLPCTVLCDQAGDCARVRCTTSNACAISCVAKDSCDGVTCRSSSCTVFCDGNDACHGDAGIALEAGAARLTCQGGGACDTAASCDGTCVLDCNRTGGGANCPSPAPCSGTCNDWKP